MNTILLIGIIQALFLLLLVLNKKGKSQADYILMGMLIYTAMSQFFFYLNFNDHIKVPHWMMILGGGFPLLYGPILFWYVLALKRSAPVHVKIFLIHLLPYIALVISFLWFHYKVDGSEVLIFDGFVHLKGYFPGIMHLYSIFFAISAGLYPLACLFYLYQHKRNIHIQFSYEEEITLDWLKILIVFTIIAFLVSFFTILFIVDWNWSENPRNAFYVVSGINTLFVFVMGYFGLKQTLIFSSGEFIMAESKPETQYNRSGLEKNKSEEIINNLDHLMNTENPWINPKLSLQSLAESLKISSNHLSQSINENKNLNFFEYVNEFRVEEFKRKLSNPQNNHLTLLGIAYDCGFNSKSSFNHIFKSKTGFTPSAFKNSLKQKESNPVRSGA